ncbi:hypothetical protein AUK05_03580 [Candidatus Shapirobacteria bacterium CG2_30_35_20]|uniref:Bro-N domain-containing protein n=1 Tax=Candidatus Shapirobacteria bacterium CG2_30_35_20 TaxID=1805376 RepID=A0A1J5HMB5_9BACT|nr:MAG: hypothetical protein AUK05_03580 [Candidatus Shapirobacteria bacterium CG2_30_35_20]
MDTKIAIFKGNEVRKIIYQNEWWFSVIDVIEVLTNNDRPRKYWSDLKTKLQKEGYVEVSEKIGQLKMLASDDKMRKTDCANTEGMFRIIQSIPSPKAEPFKRWLAKVGFERIKKVKGLKCENLRDHMDDFELIFTMLGERSTTEIHKIENSQGINKLKSDSRRGGEIAMVARKRLEKETGQSVINPKNFLSLKNKNRAL